MGRVNYAPSGGLEVCLRPFLCQGLSSKIVSDGTAPISIHPRPSEILPPMKDEHCAFQPAVGGLVKLYESYERLAGCDVM